MEGKWKIFLILVGLLACFGLFFLIKGSMSINPSQANIEQIKKNCDDINVENIIRIEESN